MSFFGGFWEVFGIRFYPALTQGGGRQRAGDVALMG